MTFSPQQSKVFVLLFRDLSGKELAHALGLNERTISTYAQSIYEKCGVKTRIGFIHKVYEKFWEIGQGTTDLSEETQALVLEALRPRNDS